MKPPPFLVGGAALFWGWQTGFLIPGALMGVVLESPRFIRARWEFSDEDLSRIWTFCSILFLAAIIYAFASNDGVSSFAGLFQEPTLNAQQRAGDTSSRTAVLIIRWLPMMVFLFVAAQSYNAHERMPWATISLIYRLRMKRTGETREQAPAMTTGNIRYSFFAACLFAACASTKRDWTFFAGFCVLMAWVLCQYRSRRFSFAGWAAFILLVMLLGYKGQQGIVHLQGLANRYNPQWFAGWAQRGVDPEKTRTQLGEIGRIKTSGRIALRLKTLEGQAPPGLLREASYRRYSAQSWMAGEGRGQFHYMSPDNDGMTWQLLTDKTNTTSVRIACALPGEKALLPLPSGSAKLANFPDYILLSSNLNGAVLAEQSGLVIFEAHYGPGRTVDEPPDTNMDLMIPEREEAAVVSVIRELQPMGEGRREKLMALERFFAGKFDYSHWQDGPAPGDNDDSPSGSKPCRRCGRYHGSGITNDTALGRFLLETRSGHCEYFATATVLLLRKLGIPARYAVGYAVHEGSGNRYVARGRDAHAWCLVWNEDTATWDDFDTTPGSWIEEEGRRASMFQWLSDGWSRIKFEIAKIRWGQTNIRKYLLWVLIPGLAFLLYQIVFRKRKRRGRLSGSMAAPAAWPGLDSEFYRIEKRLQTLGFGRHAGEPGVRWLERITENGSVGGLKETLQTILALHYRLRFDPRGLPVELRTDLRRRVEGCLADLGRVKI